MSKEFPVNFIKPTYKLLTNPLFFKYLCTLGHGIFSSLPYSSVVTVGEIKIKNGTSATHDYVIALWMILTGLAANPLSMDAKTLVSSHMAYLLDIRDNFQNLTVAYPNEPILAIVAHKLIDELPGEELFSVLKRRFEAVYLNCGSLAENFAEMIVLRAIHKSKSVETKVTNSNYEQYLNEIIELVPDFQDLWETHARVLEDPKAGLIEKLQSLKQKYPEFTQEAYESLKSARMDTGIKEKIAEMDAFFTERSELEKELGRFERLPEPSCQSFEHTL